MRLIYHLEAEAEVIASARYYEDQVPGLGARFLNQLEHFMKELPKHPTRWSARRNGARRALLNNSHSASTIAFSQTNCAFLRSPTIAAIRITVGAAHQTNSNG